MLALETGGLVSALQGLDVRPDLIEKIVDALASEGVELTSGFAGSAIEVSQFGNRASATTLGVHYNKAYEVMQATIDGISEDLVTFAKAAQVAAAYVDDADSASAADLASARAAVEKMRQVSRHGQRDRNHDDARNGEYDRDAAGA